jgi:hypothetical protein
MAGNFPPPTMQSGFQDPFSPMSTRGKRSTESQVHLENFALRYNSQLALIERVAKEQTTDAENQAFVRRYEQDASFKRLAFKKWGELKDICERCASVVHYQPVDPHRQRQYSMETCKRMVEHLDRWINPPTYYRTLFPDIFTRPLQSEWDETILEMLHHGVNFRIGAYQRRYGRLLAADRRESGLGRRVISPILRDMKRALSNERRDFETDILKDGIYVLEKLLKETGPHGHPIIVSHCLNLVPVQQINLPSSHGVDLAPSHPVTLTPSHPINLASVDLLAAPGRVGCRFAALVAGLCFCAACLGRRSS